MGSASIDMKEDGPKKKTGRKYSVISAPGCIKPAPVTEFKGKSLCIVFYPEKALFMLGIKEFAAQQDKFQAENCRVIACTADSSWATWSTAVGLTLKGEMAAASLDKIREEAFLPDPTSYAIPTVSLVMLDEKSCIRHVMTTSLEPSDAVASALEAAKIIKTYNLPDPISCRRLTGGRDFQKKSFDRFKRKSFYDMEDEEDISSEPDDKPDFKSDFKPDCHVTTRKDHAALVYIGYNLLLNKESGQIKYLGEAELLGQCHVPFVQSMMEGGS